MLLFETYGGWSEPVVRLFRRMHDKVRNKLTKRQYENEVCVSWSTSTWLALQAQRLSVAVHIASAWEIATEMQLAGGVGARRPPLMRRAPRHGVSPHRTLSGRVVMCVCLCLCVFVCVLSRR